MFKLNADGVQIKCRTRPPRFDGIQEASMPSMFDGLTAIGVDETSYRKGHTYITVVVDHERHRVI